jgi:hypothetical protein
VPHLACCVPRLAPIFADFELQTAATTEHGRHERRGVVGETHLTSTRGEVGEEGAGGNNVGDVQSRDRVAYLVLSRCLPSDTILVVLLVIRKFADHSQAVHL